MNKAFHRKRSHTEQESLHINYQAISRLYINVTTFSLRPHYYYNHRLAFCRSCFDLCYEMTPYHSLSVSPLSSLTRFQLRWEPWEEVEEAFSYYRLLYFASSSKN